MKTKVNIITVQQSDNQALLDIGYKTFYESFGPPINKEEDIQDYLNNNFTLEKINKELQNPNSEFYFATIDTQIVGYLKVNYANAQTENVAGNTLEVERIYVIKGLRGKKIGLYLLEKAISLAKQKSAELVWLGVWKENTKAIKFYKKNGFVTFDEHQFVLGTSIQTDFMMKLEL